MKKYFIILLFCFSTVILPAFADDASSGEYDYSQDSSTFDNPHGGQKQVSDEDFQKAINQVKAANGITKAIKNRKSKRKSWKKQPVAAPPSTQKFDSAQAAKDADKADEKILLLSLPINLINGDGTDIPIGHYKILAKKDNGSLYLDFYQSSSIIAKVPAIETNSDFDEKELNFVKLIPYNSQRVKIIYGSVDVNAYTFINIKN